MENHKEHTLGRPTSQEVPVKGVQPQKIPCPICNRTFSTRSEMERHRDTAHHETKGHSEI
ncbi:MAG: C2H2-type zinc finger protein [Candidatus Bathyarchaeia archaeon]|jgi:hypothetical protein